MMSVLAAGPGEWARNAVATGGYPALAGLILAENLFPPIPSELILPVAGYYVGQGTMEYVFAVMAATLGSVTGALILYAVARYGGRSLILRLSRMVRINERDLDRADHWFDRHGPWFVLFGRLVPGVRSLISVPAGLSEMPIVRFTLLTTLGSTVWNCALIGAGWALGSQYERVGAIIGPIGTIVFGICALIALGLIVWALRRRRVGAQEA